MKELLKKNRQSKLYLLLILMTQTFGACETVEGPAGYESIDQEISRLDLDVFSDMLADTLSPPPSSDRGRARADLVEVDAGPLGDRPGHFLLTVTLDGHPAPDAVVTQGGTGRHFPLDAAAQAWVEVDPSALGQLALMAAHPAARTWGEEVTPTRRLPLTIELHSFSQEDNADYVFADPGTPDRRGTTSECGHCHLTINDRWFASPHARSAQNPIVHDLYSGRAAGISDPARCAERGGAWRLGRLPGQDELGEGCYFPIAALPALNEACETPPCSSDSIEQYGGCADCHAPGALGAGRGAGDLLAVRGNAYRYGVSCDICHRVESVRPDEPAGVGGRLRLLRPSEEGPITLGAGGYQPLTFGPSADISNPRMGTSPRAHYRDGGLCLGCHQHDHDPSEVPSLAAGVDRNRWPEGLIPNQSTWQEWREGPLGEVAPCNSCHMPPEGSGEALSLRAGPLANSANLESFPDAEIGFQGGWPRVADESRQHAWWGPRQPESQLLERAAALRLSVKEEEEQLSVELSVTNVGAGHFLPTGEPMRHLILVLEARCGTQTLTPLDGEAIPDFAGSVAERPLDRIESARWLFWPEAQLGDQISWVEQLEDYYDYSGFGPFAKGGRFSPEEKGMRRARPLGTRRVVERDEDGWVSLDAPPPESATYAYLLRSDETGEGYAGRSGFAFARVPVDTDGRRMVPHFVSVDLASDNRLPPQKSWRSAYSFPRSCSAPSVQARLIYRRYPLWLARERGWTLADQEIARAEWRRE
ncbi:MAG: hypothetical protein VYD19_04205 [Myxococcota bacterium]|nr:hypothetical protein [Myxococcota bacterium]